MKLQIGSKYTSFRRFRAALLIVVIASLLGLAPFLHPTPAQAASAGWIMAYFTENPNSYDLHIAYSNDGRRWFTLNGGRVVAHPTAGQQGLRDPFILKKQDGTFVVMATDLFGTNWSLASQYIHIWDSPDLTSFNNYRRMRMHTTTMHTWAPEAFWDASRGQYAVIWSGNTDRHRIYVNYTSDFINVSSLTPQVFFDPGFDMIDANVVTGSTNYLYYARGGRIYGARSTSLNPGSFNSGTYTSQLLQGSAIEAPQLLPNGSTWYLYGDSYSPLNNIQYAWQTTNIGANSWSALAANSYSPPPHAKHVGIVAVNATQMTNVHARWGIPTYSRIANRNSGKCLDVQSPNLDNGANVGQWACSSSAWQSWQLLDLGNGYFNIISQNSGKCLDVQSPNTSDGANVGQWVCNGQPWQEWQRVTTTAPYFRLVSRHSGKVLDVANCSTADGANVRQWAWLNNNCQQWQLQ